MSDGHFECTQCGWCCVDLLNTFDASLEDIDRWKNEARYDILRYVGTDGILFMGPETSKFVPVFCPFISFDSEKRIATCQIHYTKPDVCIDYSCWNEKKNRFQLRYGDKFHPDHGFEITQRYIQRKWLHYLRIITREPSKSLTFRITMNDSTPFNNEFGLDDAESQDFPDLTKDCATDISTIKQFIVEQIERKCDSIK